MTPLDFRRQRARMVEQQLAARGIRDPRTLAAFNGVAREAFVPDALKDQAYCDTPLPIGHGQTISQPYVVALTLEALKLRGGEKVLEVGTGSGYSAALLSLLAGEVYTVERVPALAETALERLTNLGFDAVHVSVGDGSLGDPDHAPFAAIAVAAGGPVVPPALLDQLDSGGRLVMPIGPTESSQSLVRLTRRGPSAFDTRVLKDVRFVPLIGAQAWPQAAGR
jgi:protein-L-isoaspartate(D-aspartate) O-methyltransferase